MGHAQDHDATREGKGLTLETPSADVPSLWNTYKSEAKPSELMPVQSLWLGDSPRTDGIDEEYARVLAELDVRLPPIIVHRDSLRVIDGAHRLRAAVLSARDFIETQWFDGSEDDAFVLAMEANTSNGLPLSLADRRAAAARVIATHPTRSDRWVALVSGLTATTVGAIRRCSSVENTQSNMRFGRDGRLRPVDSSVGRRLAGELMRLNPDRSLRDIAKAAGIAPSTVLDVRNRLSAGEDLVPSRRESAGRKDKPAADNSGIRRRVRDRADTDTDCDCDPLVIMQSLRQDPSLRYRETGRQLLRWLDRHTVVDQTDIPPVNGLPSHCLSTVAALSRHNARFWQTFSALVDDLWDTASSTERTGVLE